MAKLKLGIAPWLRHVICVQGGVNARVPLPTDLNTHASLAYKPLYCKLSKPQGPSRVLPETPR